MKNSIINFLNKRSCGIQYHQGFSLAEVLITIGLIGTIALFTVPSLIQGMQERATVTTLKKVHSTLSNAFTLAVQANGDPTNWNIVELNSSTGSKNILDILSPYLNLQKNCGTTSGCFSDLKYKALKGGDWDNIETTLTTALGLSKAMMADGSSFYIQARDANCQEGLGVNTSLATQNICAFITVDINGYKQPNRWGHDLFCFELTKYGIIPRGSVPDVKNAFPGQCNTSTSWGWGCAAWVIYNENLDYLHCSGLSWNGPTKCP